MKESIIILRLFSILSEIFSFKFIILSFSCIETGKVLINFLKYSIENVDRIGTYSYFLLLFFFVLEFLVFSDFSSSFFDDNISILLSVLFFSFIVSLFSSNNFLVHIFLVLFSSLLMIVSFLE